LINVECACAVPDLDGGGPGAQAWWEAPCADTESLGRGQARNHGGHLPPRNFENIA